MQPLVFDRVQRLRIADWEDTASPPRGWRPTANAVLENLPFGTIRQRVVTTSGGEPVYDFPHIIEPGGSAVLAIDDERRVGLIRIERPALLKPNPHGTYPEYQVPGDFGRIVWEAPRGSRHHGEDAAATARREFYEETGIMLRTLQYVGCTAANSAVLATPLDLFLGQASMPYDANSSPAEGIREFRFFTFEDVRNLIQSGDLICAITLSLIAHAIMSRQIG
jgi:8-oxo-dGTP pyrophosphatase MutT (NUDIX family)